MITATVYNHIGIPVGSKLPSYSSVGGYPLVYITNQSEPLCAECATDPDNDYQVSDAGVHWEGDPYNCECCQCEIESAYGPIEL